MSPLLAAHAEWQSAVDPVLWTRETMARLCQRLRAVWQLDPSVEIAFTASGTDAESLLSWLALARFERPICNVLIGPEEIGSGSTLAAAGRQFDARRPHAVDAAHAGDVLTGFPSDWIRVAGVSLRDSSGQPRTLDDLEATVDALLAAAHASGEALVLHAVAFSKTGLRAPRLSALDRWRSRYGANLLVVVDAAQGRMSPDEMARWLDREAAVLVTGSKFFGGPPFSGALLLPPALVPDPDGPPLPAGLGDYLARLDLPETWAPLTSNLRAMANPGLAFRWLAAMSSMEAYARLGEPCTTALRADVGARLRSAFEGSEVLTVWPDPVVGPDALAQGTSVWSFSIAREGRLLPMKALRRLHRALVVEPGPRFHLGQPVALTPDGDEAPGVLRVALGAPLAVRLAAGGESALEALEGDLRLLRTRLEALVASEDVRSPQA